MQSDEKRLKIIIGQLQGIERMFEEKRDCLDVLEQMKATKASMEGLINNYVEKEILKLVKKKGRKEDRCSVLLKEIIRNN